MDSGRLSKQTQLVPFRGMARIGSLLHLRMRCSWRTPCPNPRRSHGRQHAAEVGGLQLFPEAGSRARNRALMTRLGCWAKRKSPVGSALRSPLPHAVLARGQQGETLTTVGPSRVHQGQQVDAHSVRVPQRRALLGVRPAPLRESKCLWARALFPSGSQPSLPWC